MTASELRVEIRGLRKEFVREGGSRVVAVDDVSLAVHPGEIIVLLGPSGCGKSTLLRCIAGLERPDGGTICIGGQTVFDGESGTFLPANQRDVNMMFQSYALWPHMTLEDNVAYPLRIRGVPKERARAQANDYLDLVGLSGLGKQYAGSVSGGQQQRVALARTLINQPSVVLFDEPLSNVDAKVRALLRAELVRLHRELGFAAVYVTHDQIEALGLGTRIAVMRDGRVEQLADPVTIYQYPANRYTAEFVGEANLFEAEVARHSDDGSQCVLVASEGEIEIPTTELTRNRLHKEPPPIGQKVLLMVRPESCRLVANAEGLRSQPNELKARVDTVLYAGSRTEYTCLTDGMSWQVWQSGSAAPMLAGSDVRILLSPDAIRVVGEIP